MFRAIRHPSPLQFGVWSGVAFVATMLCLPFWSVWHDRQMVTADEGFAWTAARVFVDNLGKVDADELYSWYEGDLFRLGLTCALAWIVGIFAYLVRKSKMASSPIVSITADKLCHRS